MEVVYQYQIGAPQHILRVIDSMRGMSLDFGPHASSRWDEKFGKGIEKPTFLSREATWIEATAVDGRIDKVLFRCPLDSLTDMVLSVVKKTRFVCSVWRVPSWWAQGSGPTNPTKFYGGRNESQPNVSKTLRLAEGRKAVRVPLPSIGVCQERRH